MYTNVKKIAGAISGLLLIGLCFVPVTITEDGITKEKYANVYSYIYHETFK